MAGQNNAQWEGHQVLGAKSPGWDENEIAGRGGNPGVMGSRQWRLQFHKWTILYKIIPQIDNTIPSIDNTIQYNITNAKYNTLSGQYNTIQYNTINA